MIDVRSAVTRHAPFVENLRHGAATMGAVYLLALVEGRTAGCGMISVFPGTEDDAHAEADVSVLPGRRRRGIGTALLVEVSARAESIGKEGLQVEVKEDDAESIRFVERRGFVEVERQKEVVLDLAAIEAPAVGAPEGVEIVTRAARPDLERAMYRVGQEANRDIPGLDSSFEQTFDQWRSFEIERPSRRPELCFVALAGGEVVGYASLDVVSRNGYHGLTAVRRDWRRRGVGSALKRAQIAAAKAEGLTELATESEERNVPMRRLNEQPGYRARPGMIVFRGSLART